MKRALQLGLFQFISYFMIALSWRAIAIRNFVLITIIELIFPIINFMIIKRIAESKSKLDLICYTFGGTCGTLLAVWIL